MKHFTIDVLKRHPSFFSETKSFSIGFEPLFIFLKTKKASSARPKDEYETDILWYDF